MGGEDGQLRGLVRGKAGQTHLDGEDRHLGVLIWELPGLWSRTRFLAQNWALRPLKPFFPESLRAWYVRSN